MTRPPTGRCPVCGRPLRKAGISTNTKNNAPWHKAAVRRPVYVGAIGTYETVVEDCPGTGRAMQALK